ncbi:hypothetical protein [Gryllotalpicola koreensis]|uniref:Uncharacterized protein n=1 Tax=Gryllotalpicola koreensis TaxID=993086 RepID=A0ABP8A1N8_9MICO
MTDRTDRIVEIGKQIIVLLNLRTRDELSSEELARLGELTEALGVQMYGAPIDVPLQEPLEEGEVWPVPRDAVPRTVEWGIRQIETARNAGERRSAVESLVVAAQSTWPNEGDAAEYRIWWKDEFVRERKRRGWGSTPPDTRVPPA